MEPNEQYKPPEMPELNCDASRQMEEVLTKLEQTIKIAPNYEYDMKTGMIIDKEGRVFNPLKPGWSK